MCSGSRSSERIILVPVCTGPFNFLCVCMSAHVLRARVGALGVARLMPASCVGRPSRGGVASTPPPLTFYFYIQSTDGESMCWMHVFFLTSCGAGEASSDTSPGLWGAGLFLAPSLVLAWLGAPILYRLQCPPRVDLVHACFSPARTKTCSLRLFMTGVSSCASGVLVSRSDPAVNSHELRFTLWL